MSALESITVLIFDRRGHIGSIQVEILRALGVRRPRVIPDRALALPAIERFKPDVALINGLTESSYWHEAIAAMRDEVRSPDPFLPIILMAPDVSQKRLVNAVRLGIDSVLAIPALPRDVLRHLVHLSTTDRTFVRVGGYFGPCRRRWSDPGYVGPERREGLHLAAYIGADEIDRWRGQLRSETPSEQAKKLDGLLG